MPERLHDRVGHVADVAARVGPEAWQHDPVLVQGRYHRQAQLLAEGEVLRAAAGRDVHDAGALFLTDLIPGHDAMLIRRSGSSAGCEGSLHGRQLVERTHVSPALELAAGLLFENLELPHQGVLQRPAAEPEGLLTLTDLDVAQLLAHGRGHVGGQRPWRGRPHKQRLAGPIRQRELDGQAGVLAIGVALGHLVLTYAGAASGAPGHGVVALVEPAAAVAFGQERPDQVVVLVGEGEVATA